MFLCPFINKLPEKLKVYVVPSIFLFDSAILDPPSTGRWGTSKQQAQGLKEAIQEGGEEQEDQLCPPLGSAEAPPIVPHKSGSGHQRTG